VADEVSRGLSALRRQSQHRGPITCCAVAREFPNRRGSHPQATARLLRADGDHVIRHHLHFLDRNASVITRDVRLHFADLRRAFSNSCRKKTDFWTIVSPQKALPERPSFTGVATIVERRRSFDLMWRSTARTSKTFRRISRLHAAAQSVDPFLFPGALDVARTASDTRSGRRAGAQEEERAIGRAA
jgi:hypothetical protein